MKIINFTQRSDEWLAWRKNGISASDSSVVLNENPYKTRWQLWAEKTGKAIEEDISNNPYVIRGNKLEDQARQCVEKLLGEDVLLPACAQSDEHEFILASFDGLTSTNVPVEIKCPSHKNFSLVVKQGINSEPYQRYYAQIQQQIYVAGSKEGYLFFYHVTDEKEEYELFKVNRDEDYIEKLICEVEVFWQLIVANKEPELDVERDLYIPSTSEQWVTYADDYIKADKEIQLLEEKIKQYKTLRNNAQKELIAQMGSFYKADYAGVTITRYITKGAVDYLKLLSDYCPELTEESLDSYRKKSTLRTRVSVKEDIMPKNIVDKELSKQLEEANTKSTKNMYF